MCVPCTVSFIDWFWDFVNTQGHWSEVWQPIQTGMLIRQLFGQYLLATYDVSPGGYSSMIWLGTCRWDLKSDPFLYQILPKNETHFYTKATNFKQNLLQMSHYFPKLFSFQANFGNFGIRLMKLCLFLCQFKKILKIWPIFIPVFALNRGSSLYQEADFETHFSGTSPDRPLY